MFDRPQERTPLNDWNIQSRGHICHDCEQTFEDGACFHTLLGYDKGEYLRKDICQKCWEKESEGATERKDFISRWQGTYESPPPEPPEAIQKDNAEGLLRKLMGTEDVRWREASYILAVMLERKRVLKVKEQIKDETGRVFVYELAKTGDIFTIPDPDLKMEKLEQVQIEVAALLEHGLPVEGEEWPPLPPDPEAGPEPPVGQKEESTEAEPAEVEMTL